MLFNHKHSEKCFRYQTQIEDENPKRVSDAI